MSPCLFNIFLNFCKKEMRLKEVDWYVVASQFTDNTILLKECARELQRAVGEFYCCLRRKPGVKVRIVRLWSLRERK